MENKIDSINYLHESDDKICFNRNNENKIKQENKILESLDNPSININLQNKSDSLNKIHESDDKISYTENTINKI